MKFVKRISLFFVISVMCFGLGFFLGDKFSDFFYPGDDLAPNNTQKNNNTSNTGNYNTTIIDYSQGMSAGDVREEDAEKEEKKVEFRAASSTGEQLIDADTLFLVEETDLRRDTFVETEWELPDKYIGMNREEFLTAMEEYELSPPLSELERGFVSLEVKSFSEKQVLVRMNYAYTAPSTSFYLMVEKHQIVVYCDDKETLYMKTNIKLDSLPDDLQQQIISGMFVEDEKTLYYFLESYST